MFQNTLQTGVQGRSPLSTNLAARAKPRFTVLFLLQTGCKREEKKALEILKCLRLKSIFQTSKNLYS